MRGAVVGSRANEPAPFALGTGDYVPVGGTWEVLSAVASLRGLFVVTLAITYVLSVVSAIAAKRQLAGNVHNLGASPADLVCRAWDGSRFSGLDQFLPSFGRALETHTQRPLGWAARARESCLWSEKRRLPEPWSGRRSGGSSWASRGPEAGGRPT